MYRIDTQLIHKVKHVNSLFTAYRLSSPSSKAAWGPIVMIILPLAIRTRRNCNITASYFFWLCEYLSGHNRLRVERLGLLYNAQNIIQTWTISGAIKHPWMWLYTEAIDSHRMLSIRLPIIAHSSNSDVMALLWRCSVQRFQLSWRVDTVFPWFDGIDSGHHIMFVFSSMIVHVLEVPMRD